MDPIFRWVTRGNAKKKIMIPRLPSIRLDKLDKSNGFDSLEELDENVEFSLVAIVVFVIVSMFDILLELYPIAVMPAT
jgi:hypothetical protein